MILPRSRDPIAWRIHAWGESDIEDRMLSDGLIGYRARVLGALGAAVLGTSPRRRMRR